MPLFELQRQLQSRCSENLKLLITDNHSTMVNVRWKPECTTVSLHRMFLDAPTPVMEALASSIAKKQKVVSPKVKAFIQAGLQTLNYSDRIAELDHQGEVYNLKEIYDEINQQYFDESVDLKITWFGKPRQRHRSRVTFGLYHDPLRLIKVHRLMDSPKFPEYVLSFIIYHEMLHHVCPAYVDEQGVHRIHHPEFKKREKQFKGFAQATAWIKANKASFFI